MDFISRHLISPFQPLSSAQDVQVHNSCSVLAPDHRQGNPWGTTPWCGPSPPKDCAHHGAEGAQWDRAWPCAGALLCLWVSSQLSSPFRLWTHSREIRLGSFAVQGLSLFCDENEPVPEGRKEQSAFRATSHRRGFYIESSVKWSAGFSKLGICFM